MFFLCSLSVNLRCQITCVLMDNNKVCLCVPHHAADIYNQPNYTQSESSIHLVTLYSE